MRTLADKYGIRHIQLTDNAVPVKMLKVLAENGDTLADLNWFGFVRFEAVFEDADFVHRLAQSGCRMLQVGLTGSQQVLDRLGKGVRLESAARILKNLAAAGVASYVYILLGTPGETEADAEMTLEFLKRMPEIGFLNISIMNLPRASGLLDNVDDGQAARVAVALLVSAFADQPSRVEPVIAEPVPEVAAPPAPAVQASAEAKSAAAGSTSKYIEIDLERLQSIGIVTPNAPRSLIGDEFRIIKRPLLRNPCASTILLAE